ncbi:T-cell surface antigen CD2 [Rhinichthys klamathensis goyatoka]|uniref:T-cell surface antigen CD2 n=1 Tax=Rhinichthys klamathensis goyatoka TaxID=3034132 RepID=UPI0024B58EE7|nr:T-cell surface antigen CD2 [Rhinichthys klamathensis goyatoka]
MMINFTLILLFYLIFIFSSGKFVSSSCMYKAVGERVEISLDIGELPKESDELMWTHNQIRVYFKRGSNVKTRVLDVDRYGSLIVENIQKKQSGKYESQVYDKDGKLIKKSTHQLCVQERVPEPTVMVECVANGVDLSCSPLNSSEVLVSWMRNGEKSNSTRAVLHVSSSELKPGDTFSCTLTNMISRSSAKDVQPKCSDTGYRAQLITVYSHKKKKLLFGLDFWWMLVILTGGASFLLVLLIICLVCVCRCRARNKRKATEEAEFRLVSLMPDYTDQPDVQYMQKTESHRPSKSMRPLPPLPSSHGPPPLQPH